jgi:hypothetical protein
VDGLGEDLPAVGTEAPDASSDEVKAVEVALEVEEKRKAKSKVFYKRTRSSSFNFVSRPQSVLRSSSVLCKRLWDPLLTLRRFF